MRTHLLPVSSAAKYSVMPAKPFKYAAMVSHDRQCSGGKGASRVARVVRSLERLGLICCFDDEYPMNNNAHEKMTETVTQSGGFLAFVTRLYNDKVSGSDPKDHCKVEFQAALEQKGPGNMLAIAMDEEMRDTRAWGGLMASISGNKHFTMPNVDSLLDTELDTMLQSSLVPLMTWLTPDSFTKGAFACYRRQSIHMMGSHRCSK